MALDDYSALIQSGQSLIPDPTRQMALRAQAESLRAEAEANAQKVNRAQQFQHDIHTYDGSPSSASELMLKYPEYAGPIKEAHGIQDTVKRTADLQNMGEIYSAATSGNWKLAKDLAHRRADAEKAAGHSDPGYDAALGVLDTAADSDPTQQKLVLNMLGMSIAAMTGPEKFEETYGALTKGKTPELRNVEMGANVISVDPETGKATEIYKSPYFKDAEGNVAIRNDAGGGGQASPSGTAAAPPSAAPDGFDHAVDTVLSNEGGYNPRDMNGAPVNFGINQKANPDVDVKNLTRDQARQIYHDKYWVPSGAQYLAANLQTPYFDAYIRNPAAAKSALAKSGGDPEKFVQIASGYFQTLAKKPSGAKYAEAWAARDANNMAIATGGAPASASPTDPTSDAPPGYHWISHKSQARVLTAQEASARGLSTAKTYELRPDGSITAIGDSTANENTLSQYGIADNETGPSVLTKLPATLAAQVKAVADGRRAPPSTTALARSGPAAAYWNRVLQLTNQYDPSYDDSSFPARKAAITAFTGMGKGAVLVGSINRVANHMDLLWNESKKLAGPETGWSVTNSLLARGGQSFQPADAKAYDGEVTFVAGELGKLAKAGITTEGEVDRIISNLGRANSSGTRKTAIQAAVGIIAGAVNPLKDQYNSAFVNGSTRPNIPWVTPKAQEIFGKIGGVDLSLTGAGADTNAPSGGSLPKGAKVVGTYQGKRVIEVNGKRMVEQ